MKKDLQKRPAIPTAKKTAIQDQGLQEELIYQCLNASPKQFTFSPGKMIRFLPSMALNL